MQAEDLAGRQQRLEAEQLGEISDLPPRLAIAQRRAEHQRLAPGGTRQPEQELDHRGLARAVRSEEAEDLSPLHRHRQRVNRERVAEPLAQSDGVDRRGVRGRGSELPTRSAPASRPGHRSWVGVAVDGDRLSRVGPRHSAHLAGRGFPRRRGPCPRPSSQTTPAAAFEESARSTPGQPATCTERTEAPGGTGTGRVVLKSPSRRISSASSGGCPAGPAGRLRSGRGSRPWRRAVGRGIVTTARVGTSVPPGPRTPRARPDRRRRSPSCRQRPRRRS